jgi:C-terminal processing protease CtpA/Prc
MCPALHRPVLAALLLTTPACRTLPERPVPLDDWSDCSPEGKRTYLQLRMNQEYLWPRGMRHPDVDDYGDLHEFLDDMVFERRDRWSAVYTKGQLDAWNDGAPVGAGLRIVDSGDDRNRVAVVVPDSPADRAGVRRGDRIVSVNGADADTLTDGALWDAAWGPREAGRSVRLELRSPADDTEREVVLDQEPVRMPPVLGARSFAAGQHRVGYLQLTGFVAEAPRALEGTVGTFAEEGVDTLVLDLRYNSGGNLDVLEQLGGMLAPDHAGEPFFALHHPPRHADRDVVVDLPRARVALELRELVVLTGPETASASELLILALEPYLPVTQIGSRTDGKPVGSLVKGFCNEVFAPMTFTMGTVEGPTDHFEGLEPDCWAPDELDAEPGAEDDPMVEAALAVLDGGDCPAGVSKSREAGRLRPTGGVGAGAWLLAEGPLLLD